MTAFPFQIVLPTFLPPSTKLENTEMTGLKAEIKYTVSACIFPTLYKTSFDVIILRNLNPPKILESAIDKTEGGLFGLAATHFKTSFTIEKFCYYPGEPISVTVDCDNSACYQYVKSFKFKLFRRVEINVGNKVLKKFTVFDNKVRHPGVESGQRQKRVINFNMYNFESDKTTKLCGSIHTKNFSVSYELKCFAKHAGLL